MELVLVPGTAMSPTNPTFSQSNFKVETDVKEASAQGESIA